MTEQTFTPTALTGVESDISLEAAYDAHRGTSWTPDERAQGERRGWVELMQADYAAVMKSAKSDDQRQVLDLAFIDYRFGLLAKKRALLAAHSRVVSSFIAGPSNFPARQMEKRNATYDKRMGEYIEYREKALARMHKTFSEPVGIRTGEAGAVDALQAKIDKAVELQTVMKNVNAAMRKHAKAGPEVQVSAMVAAGVTETQARGLLTPDFCGRLGFPDYAMTNNNANIKRMKEQQEKAQKLAATETSERMVGDVRIVDNAEDDRLQMFFSDKPGEAIRGLLKAHGFRWSPNSGAWQAYRGGNAVYWCKVIAVEYGKTA